MSKAILVIDTPKDGSCFECKVVDSCKVNPKYIHSVPKEVCPLQDTTELLGALKSIIENTEWEFIKENAIRVYTALGGNK